ncbi:MAG: peptide deformylase [Ectothiorhodospiraceae bacterium AqS1]|nr:peptide deformylase [Ectothiorhodospiraceae bacterium AqS1]
MALLDILHFPDPRLRNRALPVKTIDDRIRRIVDDMLETMYAAPGIGLAATQVNIAQRIVTIDISESRDKPLCLINPEILELGQILREAEEGCLSVPGVFESVRRPNRVRVRSLDREGRSGEFEAQGLLAVCIQHEIDHLDGKLFTDRLSRLKRDRIRKRAEKELRAA